MIHSGHPKFSITGIPAEDAAWKPTSVGFMYLNVFDVRDRFNDWDADVVFQIMEAFREICGDDDYEYMKDPEYRQLCVYTLDMEWQMLAKLHGFADALFPRLEQVVHRVTPQVKRFLPKGWKPPEPSPEFERIFAKHADENA